MKKKIWMMLLCGALVCFPLGGSGPDPMENCVPRVLDRVIIPKNITVHLGKPAASARNVTVSFRDYIANVASSEVYPTWADENNPTGHEIGRAHV